jgi:hypothetical protein
MRIAMATTQRTATVSRRGFSPGLAVLLGSLVAPRVAAKPVTPKNTIPCRAAPGGGIPPGGNAGVDD